MVDIKTASQHLDALITRACAGELIGVISNCGALVLIKPIESPSTVPEKRKAVQKARARK